MSVTLQLERDRAYRSLLDLILRGEVDPDTPLSERKLAGSLDIGRTPVRESVREHLAILEAIEGGDGQSAQRLICDHLSKGLRVRTRIFNSLTDHVPASHSPDAVTQEA